MTTTTASEKIPNGPSACPAGFYYMVINATTGAVACTICPAGKEIFKLFIYR